MRSQSTLASFALIGLMSACGTPPEDTDERATLSSNARQKDGTTELTCSWSYVADVYQEVSLLYNANCRNQPCASASLHLPKPLSTGKKYWVNYGVAGGSYAGNNWWMNVDPDGSGTDACWVWAGNFGLHP